MWGEFLISYNNVRQSVFPYIQTIVETFNEKVDVLIDRLDPLIGSTVDLVLPEFLQEMSLLGFMTSALLPAVLIVFIIRLFT